MVGGRFLSHLGFREDIYPIGTQETVPRRNQMLTEDLFNNYSRRK